MVLRATQREGYRAGIGWSILYTMTYTFKISRRLAVSHRPGRVVATIALLSLLTACGASSSTGPDNSSTPATPGWLTVQLTTPFADDGAVQLRVTGPAIDSVAPEVRYDGFGSTTSGVADVLIAGEISSGDVARFRVSDVNRASQYTVSVVAAAQQATFALRPNTSAYRAVIVR